ncbi:hypothetical protein D922_03645 [Enterococcus faecalis 06-MB-DW-09]|nr:hypothetical protein D922_03645 [Enterococcus faecalis 06-MB-DW-09]
MIRYFEANKVSLEKKTAFLNVTQMSGNREKPPLPKAKVVVYLFFFI